MRFRATIKQSGRTATGIRVPEEVVAALGSGKRPAVRVTIGGHTYRSTVAPMGGAFMIGVSAENRRAGVGRWRRGRRGDRAPHGASRGGGASRLRPGAET